MTSIPCASSAEKAVYVSRAAQALDIPGVRKHVSGREYLTRPIRRCRQSWLNLNGKEKTSIGLDACEHDTQ